MNSAWNRTQVDDLDLPPFRRDRRAPETGGISVVITCYNLQDYIAQAIGSVLAQTLRSQVQVIVVDDGSTDSSVERIAEFPQVELLRAQANGGVLMATVLGIRSARYDVVAFLDGDDAWHPGKLEAIMRLFASDRDVGAVTHDLRYVDAQGIPLDIHSRPSMVLSACPSPSERGDMVRRGILEQRDYVWLGSALSIRRSTVDADAFCRFAESLPDPRNTYQDWPLATWCAVNLHAKLAYVPEALFDYRLHGSNHSGDARSLDKAIRNIGRTCNTLAACEGIIERFSADKDGLLQTRRKKHYYRSVLSLYRGERLRAWGGFLASWRYLAQGDIGFLKEFARFAGISIFGYERFFRLFGRS